MIHELKTFRLICDSDCCGREIVVSGTSIDSHRLWSEVNDLGWKLVRLGKDPLEVWCFHHQKDVK